MSKPVHGLFDIEIDEISTVDVPANQHGYIRIAKRATEEDNVPEEIYDENGQVLDVESLTLGQTVFDADGTAYEVVNDDELADEFEPVGKSANWADEIRTELSKAFDESAKDEIISKAFGQVKSLEKELAEVKEIAKAERNLRLTGEYVEVAKSYNVPVDPNVLGPVLMRMSESMSFDDCRVIHKALTDAGRHIFDEIGHVGGGDNYDIMSQVDAFLSEDVSKAADQVSKSAGVENYFAQNPDAYDRYMSEKSR